MRHNASKPAKHAQQQYKRQRDAQVPEGTRFLVGQLIYIDHPPLSTATADKIAVEAYLKLLPRTFAPYSVSSTTSHTTIIDQNRIPNTISADRSSLAAIDMPPKHSVVIGEQNQTLSNTSIRSPRKHNNQPGQSKDKESEMQEYRANYTLKQVGNGS